MIRETVQKLSVKAAGQVAGVKTPEEEEETQEAGISLGIKIALDHLQSGREMFYDPDQPRDPEGSSTGGQWTGAGGGGGGASGGSKDKSPKGYQSRAEAAIKKASMAVYDLQEKGGRDDASFYAAQRGLAEMSAAAEALEDPEAYGGAKVEAARATIDMFDAVIEQGYGADVAAAVAGSATQWHAAHLNASLEWAVAKAKSEGRAVTTPVGIHVNVNADMIGGFEVRQRFAQTYVKEKYGEMFTVFRGVTGQVPDDPGKADLKAHVLSSWTAREDIASAFGDRVVKMEISYKDVWNYDHIGSSSSNYLEDAEEIVLIGSGDRYHVTVEDPLNPSESTKPKMAEAGKVAELTISDDEHESWREHLESWKGAA